MIYTHIYIKLGTFFKISLLFLSYTAPASHEATTKMSVSTEVSS